MDKLKSFADSCTIGWLASCGAYDNGISLGLYWAGNKNAPGLQTDVAFMPRGDTQRWWFKPSKSAAIHPRRIFASGQATNKPTYTPTAAARLPRGPCRLIKDALNQRHYSHAKDQTVPFLRCECNWKSGIHWEWLFLPSKKQFCY